MVDQMEKQMAARMVLMTVARMDNQMVGVLDLMMVDAMGDLTAVSWVVMMAD